MNGPTTAADVTAEEEPASLKDEVVPDSPVPGTKYATSPESVVNAIAEGNSVAIASEATNKKPRTPPSNLPPLGAGKVIASDTDIPVREVDSVVTTEQMTMPTPPAIEKPVAKINQMTISEPTEPRMGPKTPPKHLPALVTRKSTIRDASVSPTKNLSVSLGAAAESSTAPTTVKIEAPIAEFKQVVTNSEPAEHKVEPAGDLPPLIAVKTIAQEMPSLATDEPSGLLKTVESLAAPLAVSVDISVSETTQVPTILEQAEAQMELSVRPENSLPSADVKPMVPIRRPTSYPQINLIDKQPSGIKPIVPLRKRGQSFRETKKMITTVDAEGRRHLNQYTFMEELGRGAYGVVFKVECNETKQIFAAKTVDKKALKRIRVGRFGNALQSVKKELNIWKRFKHRHIVVLREVIDTDDSNELYMISELVDGGPVLDDDINCTPLNADLTKAYFTHLIEGIDFLHENKIIHRDIKPGNLLLKTVDDDEIILKIADFGVSHEVENDNENMRQTAGTAIFMSPEMLTGEHFLGKPVDIWACGVTLYMFVYGHPPFVAKTMTELYAKIQNDSIEYPTNVGERIVEDDLIELLKYILEKDPKKRYTSQQIRAHPWAWRDFQVSAIKCVTHPEGKRSSFSAIPKSLAEVASIGKSMRGLFARPSAVFPGATSRSSLPTVMTGLRVQAPQ